jgi:transposase
MTDHTPISQVSRLEVISTGARRRWTVAEKQRIVAESYSGPRVVSATARRNGLSASQLFTWRRLARAGRLIEVEEAATFAPAIISREASSTSSPSFLLRRDPLCEHLFCFRGRRGDLLKVIWHDGQGACLFTKRLERGRFLWPSVADGAVTISSAQLGYLLSGIDWRHPQEIWRPTSAG